MSLRWYDHIQSQDHSVTVDANSLAYLLQPCRSVVIQGMSRLDPEWLCPRTLTRPHVIEILPFQPRIHSPIMSSASPPRTSGMNETRSNPQVGRPALYERTVLVPFTEQLSRSPGIFLDEWTVPDPHPKLTRRAGIPKSERKSKNFPSPNAAVNRDTPAPAHRTCPGWTGG